MKTIPTSIKSEAVAAARAARAEGKTAKVFRTERHIPGSGNRPFPRTEIRYFVEVL